MNAVLIAIVLAGTAPWSNQTAYTVPPNRLEVSVFRGAAYGVTDNLELGTHPLVSLVHPYVYGKVGIKQVGVWDIATRHRISYPTPLLRRVAREGTGGILPGNSVVPSIVALNNEVLATYMSDIGHLLTLRAGLRNALILGDSSMPTIDFPVLFTRTAPFHGATLVNLGVVWQFRPPDPSWDMSVGTEVFLFVGDSPWSWETDFMVSYPFGQHVLVRGGIKIVTGRYPYGVETRTLPLIDVTLAFF